MYKGYLFIIFIIRSNIAERINEIFRNLFLPPFFIIICTKIYISKKKRKKRKILNSVLHSLSYVTISLCATILGPADYLSTTFLSRHVGTTACRKSDKPEYGHATK